MGIKELGGSAALKEWTENLPIYGFDGLLLNYDKEFDCVMPYKSLHIPFQTYLLRKSIFIGRSLNLRVSPIPLEEISGLAKGHAGFSKIIALLFNSSFSRLYRSGLCVRLKSLHISSSTSNSLRDFGVACIGFPWLPAYVHLYFQ